MKKIFYFCAVVMMTAMFSCSGNGTAGSDADTIDTANVDTTLVDSLVCPD